MTRTSAFKTSIAAHACKLAILQDAQQADLRGQTHVADFVKKRRAAVGLFESGLLRGAS